MSLDINKIPPDDVSLFTAGIVNDLPGFWNDHLIKTPPFREVMFRKRREGGYGIKHYPWLKVATLLHESIDCILISYRLSAKDDEVRDLFLLDEVEKARGKVLEFATKALGL